MAGRDLSSELFGDATGASVGSGRDLSEGLFDAPKKAAISWSDVPLEALKNIPSSAGNFLSGIASAVAHPSDTAGNMMDMAAGGLKNLAGRVLPESAMRAIDSIDPNLQSSRNAEKTADTVGQFMKDRYGSMEGLKNTLSTDPIGAASDVSALAGGGAALAGKLPAASSAARALQTASRLTNPLTPVNSAVSAAAPMVGNGIANLVGGLGTHTGAESIKQAFRSGSEGGNSASSFADNMRGNANMGDVLNTAKENIAAMGQQKAAAYRQGMAAISGDKSILNFNGIDQAISDAAGMVNYKGQVKNVRAAQVMQDIADEVANWKSLNPAEYHTPEGLDALKQKIGGIVESIPFEEKTAGMVGSKIYNAIKGEITQQAPTYAKTMQAYSEASDQIKEIEKALSLGKKASVDTAMRKLQSLMRNNVNTNYGSRLDMANQLEQAGGQQIMPALAGQAMSSWTPRGLGGAVAGGLGIGSYALGGPAAAIPALAAQSPRLVGEAALAAGRVGGAAGSASNKLSGLLGEAGLTPAELANYLATVGRMQP